MRNLQNALPWQTQMLLPSETLLVFVLFAGIFLLGVAFLWALFSLLRHGGRRWTWSLVLLLAVPIIAAGLFVAVLAERVSLLDIPPDVMANILILVFLASIAILVLVVFVGSFARYSATRGAVRLGILGVLLAAAPFVYTRAVEPILFQYFRPAWVSRVDGKLHVTVTGSPNFDYDRLKEYEDAEVLQMANPEVTDETLKKLENFKLLKELDLNDTQINDAGLAILKSCASLETLRLANTKITDEGFREQILPRDWIKEVDVTGTPVTGKTLREWVKRGKALGLDRKHLGG
jgi:Leucine Rich repeat